MVKMPSFSANVRYFNSYPYTGNSKVGTCIYVGCEWQYYFSTFPTLWAYIITHTCIFQRKYKQINANVIHKTMFTHVITVYANFNAVFSAFFITAHSFLNTFLPSSDIVHSHPFCIILSLSYPQILAHKRAFFNHTPLLFLPTKKYTRTCIGVCIFCWSRCKIMKRKIYFIQPPSEEW